MRRRILPSFAATFLLLAIALASRAVACPSGYESPARLVKGAAHLVEVEVLTVADEPIPDQGASGARRSSGGGGEDGDDGGERKAARARVRVVRDVRGRMPVREFTLVGGPYMSCAPYDAFLHFEPGERLFLLLARPVSEGTTEIRISWRCRAFRDDAAALDEVVRAGRATWDRRVALLRRVAPEAMKSADGLLAARAPDGDWPSDVLRPLAYPVLAGLAALVADPTRPWSVPAAVAEPAAEGEPAPVAPANSYDAGPEHGAPLPSHLEAEFARRRDSGVEEVKAMIAFQRDVAAAMLVGEFGQPAVRARRYVESVGAETWMRSVVPCYELEARNRGDRELYSIDLLLALASDEPDTLVWLFSVAPRELDAAVFAPWLKDHAKDLPDHWTHLAVTLALRSAEAAPHVQRAFEHSGDDWRIDEFLGFFLAVGDAARVDEVLRRLAQLVDEATAPQATARAASNARGTIEDAIKAADEAGAAGKTCRARLDALVARLPPP